MSDLIPITEAEERRLLSAVSGAIRRANAGDSASVALAKAAAAEGLNVDFSRRAVHIFNTTKTLRHIKDNRDDGDKRAASFELADPDEVLRLMVGDADEPEPPETKTAATMPDYATLTPGPLPRLVMAPPEPYPGDPDEKYAKVSRLLNAKRIEAERLRVKLASLSDRRRAEFDRLIEMFREPDSVRFDVFKEKAAAKYGSAVEPVLAALGGRVRSFGKSASFAAASRAVDRFDAALEAAKDAQAAKRACEEVEAELKAMKDMYAEARRAPRPFAATKVAAAPPRTAADTTGSATSDLGKWLDDYLKPLTPKPVAPKDTGFADRVKSIDAQAQLAKLLATDDVIGRGNYDPDEVYAAYNELTRFTPEIANQPLLLRAELRRYLESAGTGKGLSTFDAGQVADAIATAEKTWDSGADYVN